MAKKPKILKKKVEFGGKQVVLWSLDGNTWSTRKSELEEIQVRHDEQRVKFGGQITKGLSSGAVTVKRGEDKDGKATVEVEKPKVAKAKSKSKAKGKTPSPKVRATSKSAKKVKSKAKKSKSTA